MKRFMYYRTGKAHHVKRENQLRKSTRVRRKNSEIVRDESPPSVPPSGGKTTGVYANNDFERYRELMKCKTIGDM